MGALLMIYGTAQSQSISFDYDNAGNRIKRYNITTPDLRPYLIMSNLTFSNTEITRPFTLRIRNVRQGTIASDLISVRIYKPAPNATISLTGVAANDWSVGNTSTYYLLTSNVDITSTTGYDITANLILPTSVSTGTFNFRSFIPDLSGGEALKDNQNNDVIISIFKQ